MLNKRRAYATLPAADLMRARGFYEDTLGFSGREESGGVLYDTTEGNTFMVFPSTGAPSGDHTQLSFEVDDLEREVTDLKQKGIRFEAVAMDGYDTQTSIVTTDDFRGAWFRDTEGNLLAVAEPTAGSRRS
ncbi:MAG: VOC family protein [Candidatus Limnocylindrales bacterium]